ncbi:unnamed protein product [Trichobilharzia szidati]|nr:unnamed protein product [Trichobilharzia szidati]
MANEDDMDEVSCAEMLIRKNAVEDSDRADLFQLFAYLHGELEARDMALAALKVDILSFIFFQADRINATNLRAKYGIIISDKQSNKECEDPFQALQRDSFFVPALGDSESALKPLYDSQLIQLENLISSQRYAQNKMRDQLVLMEKRYIKACEELEDERRKHERDAAQGDDVLVMLEKERERLKSEVEYEKLQNKKLARDVKRAVLGWREQHILCNRQKFAAASLIKERKRLCNQLANEQKRVAELERALQNNDLIIKLDSYDNKADETAVSAENKLCCDRQCELLRRKLVEETENRKKIESNFERLKADYQKLISQFNTKDTTCTRPREDSIGISVSLVNGPFVSTENQSSPESVTSGPSLKFKPNPPQRRSSDNPTPASPNVTQTDSSPISSSLAIVEQSSSSPRSLPGHTSEKSGSQLCVVPPTTTSSPPSRSSTPSPPPPPPPMQLHYPYPGMQGHLNHSPRNHSGPPPFLPCTNSNRPVPNAVSHTPVVQTCKSRNLISHQSSPPYQPSYSSSPNHSVVSGRAISNSMHSAHSGPSRKPMAVNAQYAHFHHHSPHSSPRPVSSFTQTQTKPPAAVQFSQHGGLTSNTSHSPAATHHFPAHSSHRSHASHANPIPSNTRPRNPIHNNQAGLSVAVSVMGGGHVCVNGK